MNELKEIVYNWKFVEGAVRVFKGDTKALFEVRIPKDANVACDILNEQYQVIEALLSRAEKAEAENARLVAT